MNSLAKKKNIGVIRRGVTIGVVIDQGENTDTIKMMISITVTIDETVMFAIQVILLPPISLPHNLVIGINLPTSNYVRNRRCHPNED